MTKRNSGHRTFTRSTGAKSGSETYLIAGLVVFALYCLAGWYNTLSFVTTCLVLQLTAMSPFDAAIFYHFITSQKFGPAIMRNASFGFLEAVRPNGKPTQDHCLHLYHVQPFWSSCMIAGAFFFTLPLGPVIAAIRCFYPEHSEGVNSGKYFQLWWFFLCHPIAVQGEGPSNGDGLAAMGASSSFIFPTTEKDLIQGPLDKPYWKESSCRPHLRDMFHDKLFCHRFFDEYGVKHAKVVAEVADHKRREIFLEPKDAPKQLVWKPRYSTMGLGVERFETWENVDDGETWAPSTVPYVLEEFIQSTEYAEAEWYRMTTLWAHDADKPRSGYIWRTRNKKGDPRVQTDIIGGAYCVTSEHVPFVGPAKKGTVHDPRSEKTTALAPEVDKALSLAINQMIEMHQALCTKGTHELWSIGWDIMIRDGEPYFLEFNINNGFFVADHSIAECDHMAHFYQKEFFARVNKQLVDFNPGISYYKYTKESVNTKLVTPNPRNSSRTLKVLGSMNAAAAYMFFALVSPAAILYDEPQSICALFAPLFTWRMALVVAFYMVCKTILRMTVEDACVVDHRGWSKECYWAAVFHSAIQAILFLACLANNVFYASDAPVVDRAISWMESPWQAGWGMMFIERLCLASNVAEMISDAALYTFYPGFGKAYWTHHVTTFMAAVGFFVVPDVPVGLAVSFGAWMEMGSAPLNLCNLYPSAFMYRLRTAGYIVSRFFSTLLLAYGTYSTMTRGVVSGTMAYTPLVAIWALMIVNWQWACSISNSQIAYEGSGPPKVMAVDDMSEEIRT